MTRKAILIGNEGGYRGLNFLKGVKVDVENYIEFLQSKAGGQWYREEIIVLYNVDSKVVQEIIRTADEDYIFIAYSGHGYINTYDASDYICLTDDNLSISKLAGKSVKQTIIIDACRENITEMEIEMPKLSLLEDHEEAIETRSLFDEDIKKLTQRHSSSIFYST